MKSSTSGPGHSPSEIAIKDTTVLLCYCAINVGIEVRMYDIKRIKNLFFQGQIILYTRGEHGSP